MLGTWRDGQEWWRRGGRITSLRLWASAGRRDAPEIGGELSPGANRRQRPFFSQGDYVAYRERMAEQCGRHGVEAWGYLLGSTAEDFAEELHRHEVTTRPLGARSFVQKLEALPGRTLLLRKRGQEPEARQEAKPDYLWCRR